MNRLLAVKNLLHVQALYCYNIGVKRGNCRNLSKYYKISEKSRPYFDC